MARSSKPTSVVASAARLRLTPGPRRTQKGRAGNAQRAAKYYDEVSEVWFLNNVRANAAARCIYYVALDPDEPDAEPERVEDDKVQDIWARVADQVAGQAEFIRLLELSLSVPADGWILGLNLDEPPEPDEEGENGRPAGEQWTVVPRAAVKDQADGVKAQINGQQWIELVDGRDLAIRIWRPHPFKPAEADTELRPLFDVFDEYLMIDQSVRAVARSRVARAGLLLLAKEMDLGPDDPTADSGGAEESGSSRFFAELVAHLSRPLEDESSAAALVPYVAHVPQELVEKANLIEFARDAEDFLLKRAEMLFLRIVRGLDAPPEVLAGMADLNHWCVDEQTEALTPSGWRSQNDLRVGDLVRTLNHQTGLAEWQPILDIYRADVVDEPMVSIETRNHSSLTTPDHRWPTVRVRQAGGALYSSREFVRTRQLTRAHTIPTAVPSADTPITAKYEDAFVELVAWFWTEGHSQAGSVRIAQSHTRNPERVARIRAALTCLYGPSSSSLRGSDAPAWREFEQLNRSSYGGPVTIFYLNTRASAALLEVAPGKIVSPEFICDLTTAQLALFVEVSAMADGQHCRAGRLDIWQRRSIDPDAYELALVLSGRTVVRGEDAGGYRVGVWQQDHIRPIAAAQGSGTGALSDVHYSGTIWCPVTVNQTWLARRRGTVYYTGNTAWQVDEGKFKNHWAPRIEARCALLTSIVLRPLLKAAGVADWERMRVWYDPRRLVFRPNRQQDATKGVELGGLSLATWRREHGWGDEDAPSAEEKAERLALTRGSVSPDILAQLLAAILGIVVQPSGPPSIPQLPDGDQPQEPETGPPPEEQPDADATLHSRPALTAAATGEGVRLGRRLSAIDRSLRERLHIAAEAAVRRGLERAGARVRSRALRNESTRQAVTDIPVRLVHSTLGPAVVRTLGVEEDEALDGVLAELADQFEGWTDAAALEALSLLDVEPTDLQRELLAERRGAAWAWLAAALLSLARQRLYAPDVEVPELGEAEPGQLVPIGLIRYAVALAGNRTAEPAAPVTGLAVGELILEFGQTEIESYAWEYGAFPRRPFEPHLRLDGVEFDSFEAEALANLEGWPAVPYFFPGDHAGCGCGYTVTLATGEQEGEPVALAAAAETRRR